ncbi:hypothetical protein Tco_0990645 [Tanacetum coccineum]|uniref:Uncharacterized protein n=1 Tax=Tanacetum coccineum TaxID=301880 RepID=A0ABQ5EX17_9ASTR
MTTKFGARDFAKSVKAIALPQDVPSTSNYHLIELENQVQPLMDAHLTPTQPNQVIEITTLCEIVSSPNRHSHYLHGRPRTSFNEYTPRVPIEAGGKCKQIIEGLVSEFMASQDSRLSKFEADFKQQQSKMTNKIDIVLKAITDRIAGTLPSNVVKKLKLDKYVKSLELGKNGTAFVQGEIPVKIEDPGLFTLPCRLGDSKPFDTLADLGSCLNIISLYLFKKLNIGLLEETDHIFGLADKTKSYPVIFDEKKLGNS